MAHSIRETPRGLALNLVLNLRGGLHARPAARLAKAARRYSADIRCITETGEADAKSMLDLLSLAPPAQAQVLLLANGDDAREALLELGAVFADLQE
ncbi:MULTISPECIES: HPr family phosphocarrier protein [unclassified Desulfovibrio]|uniref:HPr family phosphocarrier protein n=1 Tax=unclassified Desulfovibrio TaxID=2593640 RepID=UPI0013EB8A92|nr:MULTISPECIES: HPr family phosphocarrier protein [unclassified Desulfovibrio]